VAEEAAQKAKQLHLQSLREKVHGKPGAAGASTTTEAEKKAEAPVEKKTEKKSSQDDDDDEEEESSEEESSEEEDDNKPAPAKVATAKPTSTPAGLQSPTTSSWKSAAGSGGAFQTVQSPTTTSWKPTDVNPPISSFLGSPVENASAEKIAAVERAQTIKEESEEDDDDDGDDSDESDDDVPARKEEKKPTPAKK
jgi:hypothetical protein